MDTQQRPCRLRRSISCVKWRWCPPLMSKWLYRLSLLSLSLSLSLWLSLSHSSGSNSRARWLTTCRLQTLHTRARSLICWKRSAGLLSALPSTLKRPPCSPRKAEGHYGRSNVSLLHVMEQLLIFWPTPAIKYIPLLYQREFVLLLHLVMGFSEL